MLLREVLEAAAVDLLIRRGEAVTATGTGVAVDEATVAEAVGGQKATRPVPPFQESGLMRWRRLG